MVNVRKHTVRHMDVSNKSFKKKHIMVFVLSQRPSFAGSLPGQIWRWGDAVTDVVGLEISNLES